MKIFRNILHKIIKTEMNEITKRMKELRREKESLYNKISELEIEIQSIKNETMLKVKTKQNNK